MTETTFREMTIEHLGADATPQDLRLFQDACRVMQAALPQLTDDEVTNMIWRNGDWYGNADRLVTAARRAVEAC